MHLFIPITGGVPNWTNVYYQWVTNHYYGSSPNGWASLPWNYSDIIPFHNWNFLGYETKPRSGSVFVETYNGAGNIIIPCVVLGGGGATDTCDFDFYFSLSPFLIPVAGQSTVSGGAGDACLGSSYSNASGFVGGSHQHSHWGL